MLNGIGQRRTSGMLSLCTLGWVTQGSGEEARRTSSGGQSWSQWEDAWGGGAGCYMVFWSRLNQREPSIKFLGIL